MPIRTMETIAAGQTDQVMGDAGAAGDYLEGMLIIPATTSPGTVFIRDGNGSLITIFAGGASSVQSLAPIPVPCGFKTANGGWKVSTGANVSVIAVGEFS